MRVAILASTVLLSGCALTATSTPAPVVESAAVETVAPQPAASPAAVPQPAVPADAQRVEVVWISDGDTFGARAVRRGVLPRDVNETVRLLEIDTPESKAPGRPVECFAERATRALERMLPRGSTAWVQGDQELRDRYGRALLYVWNDHGVFVNERMVRRGFARAVLFRPNDRYIDRMRSAEDAARKAGRGLWSAC